MRFVSVCLTAALAGTALAIPAAQAAKKPAQAYDFNGDGRRDLLLFERTQSSEGDISRASLEVRYSGTKKRQVIDASTKGLPPGDPFSFGESTASADFDLDGYADLAAGDLVIYGGRTGLGTRHAVVKPPMPLEEYHGNVSAGDFDRDGRPDLLMIDQARRLWLFSAFGTGTSAAGTLAGTLPRDVSRYGPGVYAADFNGDRYTDLLTVLTPDYPPGETPRKFGMQLRHGSSSGLGAPIHVGHAGYVTAAGDINGDGRADLVTSEPSRYINKIKAIQVRSGTHTGLGPIRRFSRSTKGVPGKATRHDAFGDDLAIGDVNGDGRADVAVADSGYRLPKRRGTGSVTILYGTKKGLTGRKARMLSRNTKQIRSRTKRGQFAENLGLVNLTGSRAAELIAGRRSILIFRGGKKGPLLSGIKTLRSNGGIANR